MRYFFSILILFPFYTALANDLGVQELTPSTGLKPTVNSFGLRHELFSSAQFDPDCPEPSNSFGNYFGTNTQFLKLQESCYDQGHETSDPFENQIRVCECLSAKMAFIPLEISKDNSKSLVDTDDFSLDHLKSILTDLDIKSNARNNALILQTHILGDEISNFYELNEEKLKAKSFVEDYKKNLISSLQQQFMPSEEQKKTFEKNANEIMNKMESRPNIVDVLAKHQPEGEGCLPFKNYLKLASYPRENNFWVSMEEGYKPSEWDLENLEKDFLSNKTSPETKEVIEGKIRFLENNPLIKYVFMSGDESAAKEIHQVMQKHMSKVLKSCTKEYGLCFKQFLKNGLNDYMNEMKAALHSEKMKAAVLRGREKESEKYLASLIEKSRKRESINSLDVWSSENLKITMNECIDTLGQNRKLTTVPFVTALSSNIVETQKKLCNEAMPKYCDKVHKNPADSILRRASIQNIISDRTDDSRLSEIYRSIARQKTPDIKSNHEFKDDTERFCKGHFRFINGKSMNMESFTSKFCKKSSPDLACSNKSELLAKFMANPEDSNRNDKEYSGSNYGFIGMDAIANSGTIREMNQEEVKRYSSITSVTSWLNNRKENRLGDQNKSSASSWLASHSKTASSTGAATTNTHSSVMNMGSNAQSQNMNSYKFTASQIKEKKDELDKEIRDTKSALDYNQERAARPNVTPEFKNEVDVRIASLEKILAEKERTSKEYQNIIDKLMNQANKAETQLAQVKALPKSEEAASGEAAVAGTRQTAKSNIAASSKPETLEETHRAPASVSDNFSTSGGGNGGSFSSAGGAGTVAAGSLGAASSAQARINTALLSKYGITVQDSNANVQIAADRDQNQISPLLSDAKQQDMGLEVTRSEFEKFKKHDITALTDLYSKKIEMINSDVVRLMIHTEGIQTPLEFYAIKEKGKVVFQPVRKNKLTDLQNALIQ